MESERASEARLRSEAELPLVARPVGGAASRNQIAVFASTEPSEKRQTPWSRE
jgi:hypothetical protein